MMTTASVIVPTYNRVQSLKRTLCSLVQQDYPAESFEVIVVDDGSNEDTAEIARGTWPFDLQFVRQDHKGGTQAKNLGASIAKGEHLFFLDDDIEVSAHYLSSMIRRYQDAEKAIVMGRLVQVPLDPISVFGRIYSEQINAAEQSNLRDEYPFIECLGGFFSVKRDHFFELGQLRGIGGGWPNWEDLNFAYTAYQNGYVFLRCQAALGYHHDYSICDRKRYWRRWEVCSELAALLFRENPGLFSKTVTYYDKAPVSLSRDPLALIARKVFRAFTAWEPVLKGTEGAIELLERYHPSPALLRPLYRWMNSTYIFRGYRAGLRKYGVAVQP